MRKKKKWPMLLIDLAVTLLLLALDQYTKYLATLYLKDQPPVVLIEGVLELDYLDFGNAGAAFGILKNQKFFILFVGAVFLAVILFFLFKLPAEKKFTPVHIALSAVIAGGLGNMIDRIRLDYVVDFISFVLIHFPIFNVADCCIVVSAILLFLLFLFVYKESDLEFLSFKQKRYREIK